MVLPATPAYPIVDDSSARSIPDVNSGVLVEGWAIVGTRGGDEDGNGGKHFTMGILTPLAKG